MKRAPLAAPEQLLADGFAAQVERWARGRGAHPAAAQAAGRAAGELSLAVARGHVCLGLAQLPPAPGGAADASSWRSALLASGVVAVPGGLRALPLILDQDDRLYLQRYFDYEQRLARRLVRAGRAHFDLAGALPDLRRRLDGLFADAAPGAAPDASEGVAAADWQKLAAALALRNRLTVVSGGPGTGKTTTVVNLLACLLALEPDCRIAMAAPTGKAAARMSEAVRQRAGHLPAEIRAKLPAESFTVHRLLGARPGGEYAHHAGNLLAVDALVVDEASMLDLSLATHLLEAVPDSARIVLLGDKDQLAAVESGAVFAEISTDPSLGQACRRELAALAGTPEDRIVPPPPAAASALDDAVVWFTRNYRFAADSGIGRLAALVKAGDAEAALQWLRAGADADVAWIDDRPGQPADAPAAAMFDGYREFADAVARAPGDVGAASAAFERFRVLCAVREGPRGVVALNAAIESWFRSRTAALDADPSSDWYPGRPVLVLRNDHVLRLFNGDIGITLPDAGGDLLVHFAEPGGGFRAVAPVRLPPHESAFAMTVHKSQGSEFAQVMVVLPAQRSRVLTRELLYTAVTRARSRVTLCAAAEPLAHAVATATRRQSGLLARLRECAALQPGA